MSKNITTGNRFFGLLHRAIQPISLKTSETKKHGDYTDKQIRQHKSEDISDSQSDKSHQ